MRPPGVGNWDEVVRTGKWDVGRAPPLVLGVEASGVVLAWGAHVERPGVGEAVLTHPVPLRHQACWAQRLVAPASWSRQSQVPWDGVRPRRFRCWGLTAYQVLVETAAVQPGEWLFVHSAAVRPAARS